MDRAPGIQVFVYPEELDRIEPAALAEQVLGLGCDAVSVALAYHRARVVLPRQGRVGFSPGGAISFTPDPDRYGRLLPRPTATERQREAVEAFREACAAAGVRFRAWIVALHNEALVAAHPGLAAQTVDGTPTDFALCPSSGEAVEYVDALVGDVCARLEPESVDLEAALYPAWDPAYTLTLALEPLSERARLYGAQCFCGACRRLPGLDRLAERTLRAAGPPFARLDEGDAALTDELARARSAGAERVLVAAAAAARRTGARLCATVSGAANSARLRGLSPAWASQADRILLGLGPLSGSRLSERLDDLRSLVGSSAVTVSLNWSPERSPQAFAADVKRVAAGGATGLALYNLSLVPERGLEAFRAAARAFAPMLAP